MNKAKSFDPITLEVMRNAFYSIADEMIVALIRASYSTNIKDRINKVIFSYFLKKNILTINRIARKYGIRW